MKRSIFVLIISAIAICWVVPAQAISVGEILSAETRTGSIINPGQADSFSFNGAAGLGVVIRMSRESGSLNPDISLYAPDGTLEKRVKAGDYPVYVYAEITNYQLAQSGTYTIVVGDDGGNNTGDYSLSFLLIPGPTVSPTDPNGGDILSGETKVGTIGPRADSDAYTFHALTGQGVAIRMSRGSGTLNPDISLHAPDGTLEKCVKAGDYPVYVYAEITNYQLAQSGTYTIVVGDDGGNNTGDYSLSFLLIPGPTVSPTDPNGGDILSGETKVGTIGGRADSDAYTFHALTGQGVAIRMSRDSGTLNPDISLHAPDGTLEKREYAGGCSFCMYAEITNYQLAQSGTYTIVVGDDGGNNTGDYSLSFTKIPMSQPSPAIRIILSGEAFHGGDTLTISARVLNGPSAAEVEVKVWATLPDGSGMSLFDPHFTFTVPANADFTAELFRYTFSGGEPSGEYQVGGRFVSFISGRETSVHVKPFTFSP